MLTPSSAFARWMRGSIARVFYNRRRVGVALSANSVSYHTLRSLLKEVTLPRSLVEHLLPKHLRIRAVPHEQRANRDWPSYLLFTNRRRPEQAGTVSTSAPYMQPSLSFRVAGVGLQAMLEQIGKPIAVRICCSISHQRVEAGVSIFVAVSYAVGITVRLRTIQTVREEVKRWVFAVVHSTTVVGDRHPFERSLSGKRRQS